MASRRRSVPIPSAFAEYSGVSNETWTWRLGGKIVDLVRLALLDDPDQARGIGHIPEMEDEARILNVRVFVDILDPPRVERG